jgi:hypothetical protein
MTPHSETLAAIARLKSGEDELSSEQYLELLEAVEDAVQALILAPSGTDPLATGLWYNHERAPALARLADALAPRHGGDASDQLLEEQMSDREVLLELHAALLKSTR